MQPCQHLSIYKLFKFKIHFFSFHGTNPRGTWVLLARKGGTKADVLTLQLTSFSLQLKFAATHSHEPSGVMPLLVHARIPEADISTVHLTSLFSSFIFWFVQPPDWVSLPQAAVKLGRVHNYTDVSNVQGGVPPLDPLNPPTTTLPLLALFPKICVLISPFRLFEAGSCAAALPDA